MKNTKEAKSLVPQEIIENRILLLRGKKVMIDSDLATLYGVSTKSLKQSVKRNTKRFPEDFMFELNKEEKEEVVTNCDHLKHLKYSPYKPSVFTEQGVAMLSSVLKSEKAIQVNIQIMRTFTKIKEMIISNKELRRKMEEMENKYDEKFVVVFKVIAKLIGKPEKENDRKIGFDVKK
ncbi:MAG: KilA-N, DNA-binding domain protein [Candidatus Moranbacteria bacterium GW2011_GWC2_37_73]|nr:MAG: KilA-N, DNA-binding domain protein [Parcubacteria group bacterium GW2011_GWC1_36_108]KKQ01088.1 MAG: KilA-N, DNA-binding domain protein [Candidatus Moranbacteria bacterium GW2011_GWD1_36_198]KKQ02490.1 MAG: KilA-N, DNA-binding domain protein [Candidatus Moranbacteria bacterium GW2011_GWD2_36_198]KKQ40148.1 MAG: KilA-N, DNA-binding domain protein [Candidatus Moranbacteria bacterium GW2011_GWC2_37_73]HAS00037.1 DNA-binding protein [Candidatus Moranbacteria bacterium]